ncbi:hypothetical protein BKI52_33135 [marine bacterium AO1-C]|nr:hypothetical protein BKI52_33135 [marine bacterium AO1-C]
MSSLIGIEIRFKRVEDESFKLPTHFSSMAVVCMPDSTGNVKIINDKGEEFILLPGMSHSFPHDSQSKKPLTIDASGVGVWAQISWTV